MTNKFKKCHFRVCPENPFNCNTRDCRVEHGNDLYLLDSPDFKNYRDVIFDNNYCVEDAILNKVLNFFYSISYWPS